jgi:transcription initiation factor TFIIIB Brf1 subunit/transcription initiation factor TFIIB
VYPSWLTVLYLASVLVWDNLTQNGAAMAAGVAESTVRKENKRLRRLLNDQ